MYSSVCLQLIQQRCDEQNWQIARIDSNQVLHTHSLTDGHMFETISKLGQGFSRGGDAKFGFSH